VDAIRTLDSFTGGQEAAASDASHFTITINLGSDSETYSKPLEIGVEDVTSGDSKVVVAIPKKTKKISRKKADDDGE
jgi:hypothetical protein